MKLTKTTMFILPMFDILLSKINDVFINCYLNHNDRSYDYPVLILYLKNKKEIENINDIVNEYEDCDNYIITLKIPDNFKEDYYKIIQGQYSKISNSLKHRIKNFWGTDSQPYKVVIKSVDRKKWLEDRIGEKLDNDAELMSIFDLDKEILKTSLKIC